MSEILKKLKNNKAFKAGAGYTIGNYLLRGLGFITVPIFSRLLTTADFGIYNTFMSYEGILYLCIGLALHSSIKNAKYSFGQENLDAYTSSISIIQIIMAGLFFLVGNLIAPILTDKLGLDRMQICLLVILSLCTSIQYLYQARLVLDYETLQYLRLSYFNAFLSIILSIIFIIFVFPEQKYIGRIWGSVLPMMLVSMWILYKIYKKKQPRINAKYWKFGLRISIPIIPHGIGQVILTSFDRIMITAIVGAADAGLYSFAYTIYSVIFVAGNSLTTVFEPWAFEKLAAGETKELQKRSALFIVGLAIICAGTMLVTPELVLILGSSKYLDAIPAVPPVLFGGFFAMAYSMPSIIEYYYQKTTNIAIGTAIAAGLNIILNAAMIPRFGYVAAAYTTLASYIIYFIFHSIMAKKICGYNIVPIHISIAVTVFLSIVSFIVLRFSNNILIRYIFIIAIVIGIVGILIKIYHQNREKLKRK